MLEGAAFSRLADLVRTRGAALEKSEADIAKSVKQFDDAVVCLAVVSSPKPSPKVPQIEQVYSAGAVCLAALNAGLASGWGASWLTGWHCFDRGFVEEGLGLSPEESIAGLIFYGTEQVTPPERPRPELKEITTWISD